MGSSGGGVAAAITKIAEQVVVGAAVAQIDFLAIPQTFRNLLLIARLNSDGVNSPVRARFNADAAANYDTLLYGANAAGGLVGALLAADTSIHAGDANGGAGSDPQSFGYCELWIPNYAHAAMRKTAMSRGYRHDNVTITQRISYAGGTWRGEVPITEIRLFLEVAGNIEADSVATLYGFA
jgi:hypothetical protein